MSVCDDVGATVNKSLVGSSVTNTEGGFNFDVGTIVLETVNISSEIGGNTSSETGLVGRLQLGSADGHGVGSSVSNEGAFVGEIGAVEEGYLSDDDVGTTVVSPFGVGLNDDGRLDDDDDDGAVVVVGVCVG